MTVDKPVCWDKMVKITSGLSKDFLHVRVDFYYIHGKNIFDELTFTKGVGFGRIKPLDFDYKMGSWLELPLEIVKKKYGDEYGVNRDNCK